ncbi:MAG: hydrogenase iron-sulfur subunit [Desulfomonile tiedjei]|uniref:Hydrogenase iron-sulfur subunit n=1 Tax=Desulfomonile tiedjei TaxID=2358 RepID=A0A9D6Z404_9BACT|nr:hydrogenase iron-sulfur subunit [Desulfomonile tiedjei]
MILRHSTEVNPTGQSAETAQRVLVVGGGIPAVAAAQALMETGVQVTFARFRDVAEHVYFDMPAVHVGDYLRDLSAELDEVEIVDITRAPVVWRDHGVFRATFEDGTESAYDCLLLAPGISLRPIPLDLPVETELFTSRIKALPGQQVLFLMDYKELTHPALGMSAIRIAAETARNGGKAVVCFRHAPVLHVFGEALYDSARKDGVQFVRYGEESPKVQRLGDGGNPAGFRLAVSDIIDSENEFVWDCDRIVAVTGPDASSISEWARTMADGDLDERGFMLSDNIHSNSGRSFASGVFVVGEATGNLDLIGCMAQARAAAAQAEAWMRRSRLKREDDFLSVSTACVRCLTCYRVCPHSALSLQPQVSRSRIEPSPSFCLECGICASVCPSGAISLRAYPEESIAGLIKELTPSEISGLTFVFGCQRSAGIIAESIDMPENARFLAVPCAGSVSDYIIWGVLAAGARGVLVVGCHHGNCRSDSGTELAAARVERGKGLGVFGGKPPRIGYFTIAPNESARFQRLLHEFLGNDLP